MSQVERAEWRLRREERGRSFIFGCAEPDCRYALCERCYDEPGFAVAEGGALAGRLLCLAAEGAKKKFQLAGPRTDGPTDEAN